MKKIWLFCLCLASLSLVWCFHVPDEDWLPSRNKINSEEVKNDKEVEDAIDSFMDWINTISSDWNDTKDDNEVNNEEAEEVIEIENENIDIEERIENEEIANNEEMINTENEDQEIENAIE